MHTSDTQALAPSKTDDGQSNTTLDTLHQLRDEIRLKMHLAGMEAKEKWQELESQLEVAGQAFSHTTDNAAKLMDDTRENAKGALEDLQTRFQLFRESIKDATGH